MFSTANATPVRVLERRDPVDEPAGVVALPPERRVHDDHVGAHGLGHLGALLELAPGLDAPDPLRDQQARRVHGTDRHLVVLRQVPHRVGLLADRVDADHHLDRVVPEPGRQLEPVRRGLRVDRGGGQGDHALSLGRVPQIRLGRRGRHDESRPGWRSDPRVGRMPEEQTIEHRGRRPPRGAPLRGPRPRRDRARLLAVPASAATSWCSRTPRSTTPRRARGVGSRLVRGALDDVRARRAADPSAVPVREGVRRPAPGVRRPRGRRLSRLSRPAGPAARG